jgi:hypothetical protein
MVIMYLLPYDMVQNGHSVIVFPKWLLSNITYGTKWFLVMVRNFEILWYEMVNYGTKWQWYEMTSFA